jgi:hypothetical protein
MIKVKQLVWQKVRHLEVSGDYEIITHDLQPWSIYYRETLLKETRCNMAQAKAICQEHHE